MVRHRLLELIVGLLIIAGLAALAFLAFNVSAASMSTNSYYTLTAEFDNIGNLKVRAPVSVSGVRVGDVASITLDPITFRARVILHIEKQYNVFPEDTSASILTQGILGANYISLTPGFDQQNLVNGDQIETTHPALILENLIGQLIYSLKSDSTSDADAHATKAAAPEK